MLLTRTKTIAIAIASWAAAVSALHLSINVDWDSFLNEYRSPEKRKLTVAYIPVT